MTRHHRPGSIASGEDLQVARATDAEVVVASILRPSGGTGIQTHVHEFMRYLESRDVPSTLVTPYSWGKPLQWPVFGFRFVLNRFHAASSITWYRRWHGAFLRHALRRRLAQSDEAIVYAQCPVAAKAALQARRSVRQRVVMAVHFDTSQAEEWRAWKHISADSRTYAAIRDLEREILPRLDGLVYVSDSARRHLDWIKGIETVPSEVVPNFIRAPTPSRPEPPQRDLVTIGALDSRKNHAYLLEVLAEVKRLGYRYTLDVIGSGPDGRALERRAKALDLDGQVRFLGFRRDVRTLLRQYRAYVHVAQLEVLPLSVIESMAAGLPVVAGRVGGIPELIDTPQEGRFWPLDDADAAAAVLIGLLSNEEERAAAGRSARQHFDRCFDADVVAPHLLHFLAGPLPRDGHSLNGHRDPAGQACRAGDPGPDGLPGADRAATLEESGTQPTSNMSVRAGVTATDQAVSSLSNFAVAVAIARLSGIVGLGAFSLVYAVWLVVASMHRALITDPMAIEGDLQKADWSQHVRAGLAGELTLGIGTAGAFVVVGGFLFVLGQHTFALPFLAVAPWLPCLLAQDYWRWVSFMAAQPGKALVNDVVFDVVQFGCFALLLTTGTRSTALAISAWGAGAAAGAVFGLCQFSIRPTLRGGLERLRLRWAVSKWLVGSNAAGWGVSQSSIVLAGAMLGPVGLGGLKAATGLVSGPAMVLIQAGGSVGLPEASRALRASGWSGLRRVQRAITAAGLITVGSIALMVVLFGAKLLDLVYGHQFGQFAPIAVIISVGWCGASLGLGAILSLKATRRTHLLFRVSVLSLVASVVATAVLVPSFGIKGAAFAIVVTYAVATSAQLIAHHRHSRQAAETLFDEDPLGVAAAVGAPDEDSTLSDRPRRAGRTAPTAAVAGNGPQVEVG